MINGANWHGIWDFQKDPAVRKRILDSMQDAGITSVRLDFAWAQLEPTKGQYNWTNLDVRVQEAADHGMTVLVMLYWPAAWASSTGVAGKNVPPKVPGEFGNICGQIGKRYGTKCAGVEMWNEPDLTTFWTGSRAQFFSMLAGAYPVAKSLAPNTTFVAGSPTYLGLATNWFKDAYATTTFRPGKSYDAVAIHPYMSPSDLPPTAPKSNWSVLGIADLQNLRKAAGDTSPLWATEWGWSTHTQPADTAGYWRGVTEAQQAAYTVDQTKMMPDLGVTHSYVYTDVEMAQTPDTGGANTHERFFGLLRVDYSPKPVVGALKAYLKQPPVQPPTTDPDLTQRVEFLEAEVKDQAADIAGLHADIGNLQNADKALKSEIVTLQDQITTMASYLRAAGTLS